MSNELRYTQYTYEAGIRHATEELRKQLAAKDEALKVAKEIIQRFHDETGTCRGKNLNYGPMCEPSEKVVLDARDFLAALEAGKETE